MIDGIVNSANASNTFLINTSKTFVANNTTAAVPIFGIVGDVRVLRLWGVVTTVIGSNHTGGYFRLNDQTAQINITLNTGGATLSSLPVGTTITRSALAASIATVKSSAVGALAEPTGEGGLITSEFLAVKKATAATNIEYVYTTTNTPTTGAVQFFCEWQPRSIDGLVTAL